MAWRPSENQPLKIIRVSFEGKISHPERQNTPSATTSIYEFVAQATFQNGRLVVGRRALENGHRVPCKMLLQHRCGISRGLEDLPGEEYLLELRRDELLSSEDEDEALRDHYCFLLEQALACANLHGLDITKIVVTYPTYLSRFERFGDFDKWRLHCLRILRSVCKDHPQIQFRTANEGQCAGVYLSEEFDDPQGGLRREKLQDHFANLRADGDMYWVVVDGGSSTFNMQALALYFDEELQVQASQSVSCPGWSPGTRGGSNLPNEMIMGMCRPQLERLSVDLLEDELAAVMKDFEEQKWGYDFDIEAQGLTLRGTKPWIVVRLSALELHQAFRRVFRAGLKALRGLLSRVLQHGTDFAVIFCGGSFCSPGLWREVETLMADLRDVAATRQPDLSFQYARLADFDTHWTSAVSAGAALSTFNIPPPIDVLNGSAIGIHMLTRIPSATIDEDGSDENDSGESNDSDHGDSASVEAEYCALWRGSPTAEILLVPGSNREHFADFEIPATARLDTRFALICAPEFKYGDKKIQPWLEDEKVFERGKLYPYDLSWIVGCEDLPTGAFRLRLSGKQYDVLAGPPDQLSRQNFHDRSIDLLLSCCSIVSPGGELQYSASDKRWKLTIQTDPVTKFLMVEDAQELPMWCLTCWDEIGNESWECRDCNERFGVCGDCYDDGHGNDHNGNHTFELCAHDLPIAPDSSD